MSRRDDGAEAARSHPRHRVVARALAAITLALTSVVATLFLLEWALVRTGFDFEPMRSRAGVDELLQRREFAVRISTNALGFREPRLPGPPPARTTRVVALGDSFTQGYGVEADETYAHRLEALLGARDGRPWEVINLGVPGASPPDYLHHLRHPGLDYAPDLVLVGVMANDVHDVKSLREQEARGVMGTLRAVRVQLADRRPRWKRLPSELWPALYDLAATSVGALRAGEADAAPPRAPADDTAAPPPSRPSVPDALWEETLLALAARYGREVEVRAAVAEMDADERASLRDVVTGRWRFEEHIDQSPLYRLLSLVEPRAYLDSVLLPAAYDAAWLDLEGHLRGIAAAARDAGAEVVLVFIPAAQQVTPEVRGFLEREGFAWDPRVLRDTTLADRLAAFGRRERVPVIDLLPGFREAQADPPLYFTEDGHWTPAGHRLAARLIASELPPS